MAKVELRACLKSPMRVHWLGKWMDARTQIRSIFWNMLRIHHAADGRLPPQGAPGGVSKQALRHIPVAKLHNSKSSICWR